MMPSGRTDESSLWTSGKAILFFLLLLPTGFLLTSASGLTGFEGAFAFGILAWIVGVFGAVYCIVRRLAGPKFAALAVMFLFVILLSNLSSENRPDRLGERRRSSINQDRHHERRIVFE